jgi:hypothetical protein
MRLLTIQPSRSSGVGARWVKVLPVGGGVGCTVGDADADDDADDDALVVDDVAASLAQALTKRHVAMMATNGDAEDGRNFEDKRIMLGKIVRARVLYRKGV